MLHVYMSLIHPKAVLVGVSGSTTLANGVLFGRLGTMANRGVSFVLLDSRKESFV